ncbi:hypothetical protein AVS7_01153 [Acidovorax sp. MR-S7]|nr:hypothetical protein AVS7_01153 [Acidovorax sp. MR-S7]
MRRAAGRAYDFRLPFSQPTRPLARAHQETFALKIHSQRDFTAGLLFSAFGVAFAWGATTYSVGTGARMGPGYFPLIVGVLIALLGAVITARALTVPTEDGEPVGAIAWRPLVFIIGANLLFGVLLGGLPSIGLPPMGMIVAIYALTLIASLAGDQFNLKGVLILATVLAIGSYLAFVVALNLQFPVWPSFIVG